MRIHMKMACIGRRLYESAFMCGVGVLCIENTRPEGSCQTEILFGAH